MKNNAEICKRFCCYYAKLGNVREASIEAGFPPETALSAGLKILSNAKYRNFTEKIMSDRVSETNMVKSGLERIAFGSANDAALLVFSEEMPNPDKISELDLFNVSEIKRVKGGGVEVKLFDRQKALERLYEYAVQNSSTGASDLIKALSGMEDSVQDEV